MEQARSTIIACTSAWASCYPIILHRLSGGLDSTIVLAALLRTHSRPTIRCANWYDATEVGDERRFARLVADRAGCELRELALSESDVPAEAITQFGRIPSPSLRLEPFNNRLGVPELAREYGASGVFDGNFGDSLFFYYSDAAVRLADHIYRKGLWNRELWRIALYVSLFQGRSIYSVLREGVRNGAFPRRRSSLESLGKWRKFATREAIESLRANEDFIPPYL